MADVILTSRIQKLTKASDLYGVTLPKEVLDALAFSPDLPKPPQARADAERAIVAAIGTTDFAKVRDAALARLAVVEAMPASLVGTVHEAALAYKWRTIRDHSGEIIALFQSAVAADVERLNELAALIPVATPVTGGESLKPEVFTARYHGNEIAERLEAVAIALAPFYPGLQIGDRPTTVEARGALVRVPEDMEPANLAQVPRVLNGARRAQLSSGEANVPALWWVVAAGLGVTLALVDPDEYRHASAAIADAPNQMRVSAGATPRSAFVL